MLLNLPLTGHLKLYFILDPARVLDIMYGVVQVVHNILIDHTQLMLKNMTRYYFHKPSQISFKGDQNILKSPKFEMFLNYRLNIQSGHSVRE